MTIWIPPLTPCLVSHPFSLSTPENHLHSPALFYSGNKTSLTSCWDSGLIITYFTVLNQRIVYFCKIKYKKLERNFDHKLRTKNETRECCTCSDIEINFFKGICVLITYYVINKITRANIIKNSSILAQRSFVI